jgi:hypothetical protein
MKNNKSTGQKKNNKPLSLTAKVKNQINAEKIIRYKQSEWHGGWCACPLFCNKDNAL